MVRRLALLSLGMAACSAPDGEAILAAGGTPSRGPSESGGTTSGGTIATTGGAAGATGGAAGGQPAAAAHEFRIEFDYRFDELGWFTAPERRRTLNDAAANWSRRILDDFDEIPAGTQIRVRNLDQVDDSYMEFPIETPIDDLLIFVACSDVLIEEGVGARTRRSALFPGNMGAEFQQRLSDRWQGADQEPWAVGIAFACVDDYFFDPTPETADDIPAGSTDFLTLTMHELGHALGIGSSQTFLALTDEGATEFLGSNGILVVGGPVPLDGGDGGTHLSSDLRVDGLPVLMAPSFVASERHFPGRLEFAILEDLGYEIAPR